MEYLPTGEWWTVDEVLPATQCKPQRFILRRSEAEEGNVVRGSVTDACAGQLRVIRGALERTLFEGSDWVHLIQDDLEVIKRTGFRAARPSGPRQEGKVMPRLMASLHLRRPPTAAQRNGPAPVPVGGLGDDR